VRLLLDEHLPSALARALRSVGHDAVTLAEWFDGDLRSEPDRGVLTAAFLDGRLLISGDVHTIPDTLRTLIDEGKHHAGVILVSSRSIRHDDVRTLLSSLQDLFSRQPEREWQDQFTFLPRVSR
jgi:hypothetical protein